MRERLPLLVTLVVVAVLASLIAVRARRTGRATDSPETAAGRALDAARAGDVNGYLKCFTDPLRTQLERAVAESGREAYGASLKARGRDITGWAVTVQPDTVPDGVRLRVDVVFRDRNEVQDYVMRRIGSSWYIAELGPAATARMPIAYGTPVGAESGAAATGTGSGTP